VHKVLQSSSIVVEAAPLNSDEFHFVRIAHLSAMSSHNGAGFSVGEANGTIEELPWQVGPFAACAMAQKGCCAKFSNIRIGPKDSITHSADVADMVASHNA
jgi:hypothetical protein